MTCYLSEPGVEFEISTFFVNIFKNRSKFNKMKKPLLDNFILFLKINESHFLIKPNFCYPVQEKLDGYHGYWWISRKPHNFTKICGHHWIHLFFSDSRNVYFCTFLCKFFLVIRCIRSHISFFRLGLTPTLNMYVCHFLLWFNQFEFSQLIWQESLQVYILVKTLALHFIL